MATRRPTALVHGTVNEDRLFDLNPIKLDGFRLFAHAAKPAGRPGLSQLRAALTFAVAAQESSPFWIGDLLAYAESRADLSEALDELQSSLGLARGTVHNRRYVAKNVSQEVRQLAPGYGHAAEVASLPPAEQREWMETATKEGLSTNELRREIRAKARRRTVQGQAVLEGRYRVIYADPPWSYGQGTKGGSRIEDQYPPMSIADICALPVEVHTTPDAVLFMWVTAPLLLQNPGPREVIEAWGFTPKTGIVWDKVRGIGGSYVYVRHEHLIIATRGSCLPDVAEPMMQSVHVERRPNDFEHSQKPETFRKAIQRIYTTGPYLELFGRKPVEGWTVFGNDARLWHTR